MKKLNILLSGLLVMAGAALTSCDDCDTNSVTSLSVLTSTSNLAFDATDNDSQIITVYADGTWDCEHPDWVMVSPETGNGTTEVTVCVDNNLREGTPDNPRKAEVIFKGKTIESQTKLIVRQGGDKFRDVVPVGVDGLDKAKDEDVIIINGATVVAPLNGAYIFTTGLGNMYVKTTAELTTGAVYDIEGERATDKQGLAVLVADKITPSTAAVSTIPAPVELNADIDTYKSNTRTHLTIYGKLDGTNVIVEDAAYHGVVLDANKELGLSKYNGHLLTLNCVYAGAAAPAFNVYVTGIAADHGLVENVFWFEDFEWIEPWVAAKGSGDAVSTNNEGAQADNLKAKATVDGVELMLIEALNKRGYEFTAYNASTKAARTPQEQIYMQKNYLKFGLTGYQSGIILPSITTVPSDVDTELVFNWCSQRQGSGAWDATKIQVVINNGGQETVMDVEFYQFPDNAPFEWKTAVIDLTGIKIDRDTRITIENAKEQQGSTKALRFYLDNIKIRQKG